MGNNIFNFGSNTQYKLPITLTYDLGNSDGDKFTTTINWTLSPIKGLHDVEVFVDGFVPLEDRVIDDFTVETFRIYVHAHPPSARVG